MGKMREFFKRLLEKVRGNAHQAPALVPIPVKVKVKAKKIAKPKAKSKMSKKTKI